MRAYNCSAFFRVHSSDRKIPEEAGSTKAGNSGDRKAISGEPAKGQRDAAYGDCSDADSGQRKRAIRTE